MFTGIITNLGKLTKKENSLFTFRVNAAFCERLGEGTSIAINGICLTVCAYTNDTFSITAMPETIKRTMLQKLEVNDLVNLELPVTPQTLLSGHIVQGHVDAVGEIFEIKEEGNSKLLTVTIPSRISPYIVEKGSIALNGISLTVIVASTTSFTVGIIPYTWENTMLHQIKRGAVVNIETDILAKYIEKLMRKEEEK